MHITFDPIKRLRTLEERGLDFLDAAKISQNTVREFDDTRKDYGEQRIITIGELDGKIVVMVSTPRDNGRRIISMRHAHDKEYRKFFPNLPLPPL
jgi:uncharacterized DUF497 family protein